MALVIFVILSCYTVPIFATPTCVPEEKNFYWKMGCDGQNFPNQILVTDVKATQQGQPIDKRGGMDISISLDLLGAIKNEYGTVKKPLGDIAIRAYVKNIFGKCSWIKIPTLGILDNIDSCRMVENCHLENDAKILNARINIKDLAGILYAGISTDTYYGLSLTFKDDKQPITCLYAQHIVIKK